MILTHLSSAIAHARACCPKKSQVGGTEGVCPPSLCE
jgi:hypothetical protein